MVGQQSVVAGFDHAGTAVLGRLGTRIFVDDAIVAMNRLGQPTKILQGVKSRLVEDFQRGCRGKGEIDALVQGNIQTQCQGSFIFLANPLDSLSVLRKGVGFGVQIN